MYDRRGMVKNDIYLGRMVYENPWGILIKIDIEATEAHLPGVFDWNFMEEISKFVLFDKYTGEVLTKNFSSWYVKEIS